MPDAWNPEQYDKFAAERAQPFWDLAALLDDGPIGTAVDLGCGTGALTAELVARRDIGDMTGIDSSANMLDQAAAHAGPNLRFERGDIASWTRHAATTTSSSATPRCSGCPTTSASSRGGGLRCGRAVSSPCRSRPTPTTRRTVSPPRSRPPSRSRSAMGGTPPPDQVAVNVLAPEQYAILLDHLGASRQHVRLQVYGHTLARSADVVEWVKGTSLTRFTNVLPADLHDEFLATYTQRLLERIGDRAPYFYPFKRILFWGTK